MNADEARILTKRAEEEYLRDIDVSEFLKVIAQKVKLREYTACFNFPDHKDKPKPEQIDKLRHMKYVVNEFTPFNNNGDTDYFLRISW